MKKDLSNLIKNHQEGVFTLESFKEYLYASLVEIIKLELESLPKEEWQSTLQTWVKICVFCNGLIDKEDEERLKLYKNFSFDQLMINLSESIIEKLKTAYGMGFLEKKEPPQNLIKLGLEKAKEESEAIEFMKKFFGV
ncbi:MAG: hypothetical protein ACK4MW_06050 [Aquificaceae bacterium]